MLKEVESIRAQFPIFKNRIYLNSCSQGALSDAVRAGMEDLAEVWDREGSPWELWTERYEEARRAFAAFIGAKPNEVAVITSVSQGINAVASALDFRNRSKVVMGEFEFPTMGHIWLAQQRRGAEVQFLASKEDRIPVQSYADAIDDKTLIVPVTGVCFMNGCRSEVKAITRTAHDRGALVMLDDYQDCGTRPVDVKELGVDFYLTGTLKYLLNGAGLAFLYVKEELIPQLLPASSGWFAQANPFTFNPKLYEPAPDARRFESGTPPIPTIYLALPAIKLLQNAGIERVSEHIAGLTSALRDGCRELGVAVKTPEGSVGPLTVIRCKDATAMVALLAKQGFVCSCRHDGLRISFHLYNTMSDVKAVLEALNQSLDMLVLQKQVADTVK